MRLSEYRLVKEDGITRFARIDYDPESGLREFQYLTTLHDYDGPEGLIERLQNALKKSVIIWDREDD